MPRYWQLMAVLVLYGCAGTASMDKHTVERLPMQLLHSSAPCGVMNERLVWIEDQSTWQRIYAQVMSLRMTPPPAPHVDFSSTGVLLIAMGEQSSGGYQLSLAPSPATLAQRILSVPVIWRTPERGYRQAQLMSSACLLVQLPQQGFDMLRVVDQNQRLLMEGKR